jgi:hypothetical protein
MAVGFPTKVNYATGDVLSAQNMSDLSGTVNLVPALISDASNQYSTGKNKLYNGNFDIWQRGTSFTTSVYTADRWYVAIGGTITTSRESTIIPDGSTYSMKILTGAASSFANIYQAFEDLDLENMLGKTITASIYVRSQAAFSGNVALGIETNTTANTMTGGTWTSGASSSVTPSSSAFTRITVSYTVPVATKGLRIVGSFASAQASGTGVYWAQAQVEIASSASVFARGNSSIQGELAACQRYYYRTSVPSTSQSLLGMGRAYNTTLMENSVALPVSMRIYPATLDYANISMTASGTTHTSGTWTLRNYGDTNQVYIEYVHGSAVFTAGQVWWLATQATLAGYIGLSAEL